MSNMSGVYIGIRKRLLRKRALLKPSRPGFVVAQFDVLNQKESYGWTEFHESDFVIDRRYCGQPLEDAVGAVDAVIRDLNSVAADIIFTEYDQSVVLWDDVASLGVVLDFLKGLRNG